MIVFFYFIYEDGLKMITYMFFLYDSHIHVILKQTKQAPVVLKTHPNKSGFLWFFFRLESGELILQNPKPCC